MILIFDILKYMGLKLNVHVMKIGMSYIKVAVGISEEFIKQSS